MWRELFGYKNTSPGLKQDNQGEKPLIHIHQLVKTYHSAAGDFTVLKGIDADIYAGEFVAVVGRSGSGKSTLINMVAGIDRPTSGQILVGDVEVNRLREGELSVWRGRNLGIVFQFFQLLPMLSLLNNIMLPMDFCHMYTPRQRRERAMELLRLVDMEAHAHKLPSAISGGQQQRVAIARALANDPPILVADEPTGNLDSRTAEAVFSMFTNLVNEGKTIVMVTHDSSLAHRAPRTLRIVDGELAHELQEPKIHRAVTGLLYDEEKKNVSVPSQRYDLEISAEDYQPQKDLVRRMAV
jgi:putative ABC transport system ATP-binding protein